MKEKMVDFTEKVVINEDDIIIVRVQHVPDTQFPGNDIVVFYEGGSLLVDLKFRPTS